MKNLTLDEVAVSVRCDGDEITAILKAEYAVDGCRVIKTDAKGASSGNWKTINGAHVLIGKGGRILAGMGGKFKNLSDIKAAPKTSVNAELTNEINTIYSGTGNFLRVAKVQGFMDKLPTGAVIAVKENKPNGKLLGKYQKTNEEDFDEGTFYKDLIKSKELGREVTVSGDAIMSPYWRPGKNLTANEVTPVAFEIETE